ncbi:MAG: hypothetical protein ABIT71_13225 [Vicinamibacteraceae bacterium]
MLTSHRRIAAFVLMLGLVAGAWRPCAGWEATPEARMACCHRGGKCTMHKVTGTADTRVDQARADTCCAASEPQDAPQPPASAVVAVALVPVAGLFAQIAPPPVLPVDCWQPPPLLASRQSPRHLLLSVFLI